ncbi:Cytochrome P450 [Trinorchestia longiramus]|nr:Cytochrome P450 [Trinorchestia longiramus]
MAVPSCSVSFTNLIYSGLQRPLLASSLWGVGLPHSVLPLAAAVNRCKFAIQSVLPLAAVVNSWKFHTDAAVTQAAAASVTQNVKGFREIPGPKSLPFIGSTLQIITHKDFDRKSYFKVWQSFLKEYGQIIRVKSFHKSTIVATTNPDDIEVLFKATMKTPIRHGFQSLKFVRLANQDNCFNKKTGVLTE